MPGLLFPKQQLTLSFLVINGLKDKVKKWIDVNS